MGGDEQWLGEPGTGKSEKIRKANEKLVARKAYTLTPKGVKLSKKMRDMGMNGTPIIVDSGWLGRVTDNHVQLITEVMMLEGLLFEENGIVVVEVATTYEEDEDK